MISIEYSNDSIKVETQELNSVFDSNQLPLKLEFARQVNSKVIWDTKLSSYSWASFPDTEMIDVIVTDNLGNQIHSHKWNCIENGTFMYQKLFNFCLLNKSKNIQNKGVVVGTHNGEFGEWVPVALNKLSDIVLIEGSQKQFESLIKNYRNYENLQFVNELVTKDGGNVTFYEGGEGYTNTVVKRVIDYWEKEPITETKRESIKFSDFITDDINWIHMDVEGIDDELLYSLSDTQFNHINLIIFEYNNLSEEKREKINNFILSKGFNTFREKGICISYK